jgi:hypothetical protein
MRVWLISPAQALDARSARLSDESPGTLRHGGQTSCRREEESTPRRPSEPIFCRCGQRRRTGSGASSYFPVGCRIDCRLGHNRTVVWLFRLWQLLINTGTRVVTFLMVFLIQNSQNRDSAAIQVKLDELIRALSISKSRALSISKSRALSISKSLIV